MSVQEMARAILDIETVDEEETREWVAAEYATFDEYSARLDNQVVVGCKGCHGG